ncbi:MAG TPA: hypothetical protein VEJ63_03985 [Planctomycetota bacterium]|nr:hypothetical protein [Planctomycetota bacterium]
MSNAGLKEWLKIAESLLSMPTAALREDLPKQVIREFVKKRPGLDLHEDASGNLLVTYPARKRVSAPPLVMVAHLDHPGFWVDQIEPSGVVRLAFKGFVSEPHAIDGSGVAFFEDGNAEPIGRGKIFAAKYEKARLVSSNARVTRGRAAPHGYAMWDFPGFSIAHGKVVARCCDDLLGAAAALCVLHEIARAKPQGVAVWGLFTRAEEVGFLGALEAIRHNLLPRRARVLSLECSKALVSAPQGEGVIVRVGDRASIFDPLITEALRLAAQGVQKRDKRFKFQRKLMDGGSCEATAFCAFGYSSSGLAVPLGNYHNQAFDKKGKPCIGPESVVIDDFRCEVELLVELALHPELLDPRRCKKPAWLGERIRLARKALPASAGAAEKEPALRFNQRWTL